MVDTTGTAQRIVQAGLALSAALTCDLAIAIGAAPCSAASAVQDCYPWDIEGPSGAFWHYANKTTSLLSGAGAVAILVVAMAVPLVIHRGGLALGAIAASLAGGFLSIAGIVTGVLRLF
jgi:hypothetical protein